MSKNLFAQWSQIQRKLAGVQAQMGELHGNTSWSPNTDVYDSAGGLVVKVELAGVAPDTIHVYLDREHLIIEGVRRDPYAGETGAGYRFRQMEIEYGPFQRVIELPYPVSGRDALAHCHEGVLEIRLPRAEAATTKRIAILMQA